MRVHVLEVVGEVPEVRTVAAVNRRTPEDRVLAGAAVTAIAIAAARWQNGKAVFVRAVATFISIPVIRPAALGLELCSGDILTANSREQSFPFRIAGQMPAFGADSANRFLCRAHYVVTAALAAIAEDPGTVHGGTPQVEPSIFGAGIRLVVITETGGIFFACRL